MLIDLGAIQLKAGLIEDDLSLLHITLEPGVDSGLHRHTLERETFYVLSGQIEFEIEGRSFSAQPGETVSIPIGALHRFRNVGPEPATAVLTLNPGKLAHYFVELRGLIEQRAARTELAKLNQKYGLEFVS